MVYKFEAEASKFLQFGSWPGIILILLIILISTFIKREENTDQPLDNGKLWCGDTERKQNIIYVIQLKQIGP